MIGRILSAALLALAMAMPSWAAPVDASTAPQIQSADAPTILRGLADFHPDSSRAMTAALQAVATWLASNFELPVTAELPNVARVSQARMNALRYRGLVPPAAAEASREPSQGSATVAIYDDRSRTIYLPEDWRGNTPAELSILVHEMVHHLQNVGSLKHDCPQAREKLAYAAQGHWLAQFGRNLQDELEVDPFAILVRSSCAY